MTDVILVNEQDQEIGQMEKLEAHQKGLLHRAFSVFVFNDKNELLIQQRAIGKYHSEGLWTNTCCSHPSPEETLEQAANRRLHEEMGMVCTVKRAFSFLYRAEFENGLVEHELDHVLIGYTNYPPLLNPEEAQAYKWISLDELEKDIAQHPEKYTIWFKIILIDHIHSLKKSLSI